MDTSRLFTGAVQFLILILGISLHESAHGWLAERYGDHEARKQGRVSLNPLRHLDLFGSLLMPLFLLVTRGPLFGWGRPAPVPSAEFRGGQREAVLVAVAGPAANLILGLLASGVLLVVVRVLGPEARSTASQALTLAPLNNFTGAAAMPWFPVLFTLSQLAYLNVYLAIFNLLPVPPLDGGQIALTLLPEKWATRLERVRPFGTLIGMAFALFHVLTLMLAPLVAILWVLVNV